MPENVSFPSFGPTLFRDAEGSGRGGAVSAAGELYMPGVKGAGPLPAVVVIEGLGGLKDARERSYGKFLADHGYAALVVDSFGSRHVAKLPDNLRALLVTEAMMCADAYAALRYLRDRPEIDPDRICVIGFSYGGMISILSAHEQIRRLFADGEERFAGHAAFYGCSVARLEWPQSTGAPVLLVLGEDDRNVSIPRTRMIAEDLRRGGAAVRLEVLEDAYHQWDSDDVARRFVRFNLRHCYVSLGRDNELREARTGTRVRGRASRALMLMLGASLRGYYIQRDEEALARSDALLLDFLARATADPGPARSPASRPATKAASSHLARTSQSERKGPRRDDTAAPEAGLSAG